MLDAAADGSLAKSRMVVLTALLRLRQICCDLRLLKLGGAPPRFPPARWNCSSNCSRKRWMAAIAFLVFSQFTTMLGLLREQWPRQGIAYCYLDGSTKDRAAVVEEFQSDPPSRFFSSASRRAGGPESHGRGHGGAF